MASLETLKLMVDCGVKVALGSDFGTFPLEQSNATDIIAIPGDPFTDIPVTERVDFVMKGGVITKAGR